MQRIVREILINSFGNRWSVSPLRKSFLIVPPGKKGAEMGKIAVILACFMVICLLLPAGSALETVPDDSADLLDDDMESRPGQNSADFVKESEVRNLCPSLTQLPLMMGRPAPCLATYPLF